MRDRPLYPYIKQGLDLSGDLSLVPHSVAAPIRIPNIIYNVYLGRNSFVVDRRHPPLPRKC